MSIFYGWLADWLIRSKKLSLNATRKLLTCNSFLGNAACYVALAFTNCNKTLVIVWLCVSTLFMSSGYSSFFVRILFTLFLNKHFSKLYCIFQLNFVELSPKYAGTLMGIGNTFGNFALILAPLTAGVLTNGMVRTIIILNPSSSKYHLFFIANFISLESSISNFCCF